MPKIPIRGRIKHSISCRLRYFSALSTGIKKWKWSLMYVFMYSCDHFHLFLTGRFEVNNLINFLISILISHFSRTHSVSRSPSKLHWNLFERFFLDVHMAFTCAPASVHLTRKNAYAVVEIEDRNGSLTLTQTASSPRWIKLANFSCWQNFSCWHYCSLSIGGGW